METYTVFKDDFNGHSYMNSTENNLMIKVSIIIPVYNVALYVGDCLRSVLEQDYPEIEVIIVDDCGTDNSMEVVSEIVTDSKYEVRILKHLQNRGLSAARNTGIKEAKGDYIFFMDSDDYLLGKDAISRFVALAIKYPSAEIVFGCVRGLFSNIDAISKQNEYCDSRNEAKRIVLREWPFLAVWNRLIKKEWVLNNNLFFKEGIVAEDMLWDFYAAKHISAYAVNKVPTLFYRDVSTGLSQNKKNSKRWTDSYSYIIRDTLSHIDCRCLCAQMFFLVVVTNTYQDVTGANLNKLGRTQRILIVLASILKALFNRNIQ